MDLYNKIEKLCKERGITITEMCRQTGTARTTLSDLKKGRNRSLSSPTIKKISDYFGVTADALLGSEGITRPQATEADIKCALFGGDAHVTDEMWAEVKTFVEFVKQKNGIK